jgi:membrane protein required for colicin V production
LSSLDSAFLALIAVCALFGWLRGIWRELISFAAVAAAAIAAWYFGDSAARHFRFLADPALRRFFGFAGAFAVSYLIATVAAYVLRLFLGAPRPGAAARVAGVVAGLARGVALVIVAVFLAGLTSVPREAWWKESRAVRYVRPAANWLGAQLPADVARLFRHR